jgi:hypothetical protein
MSKKTPFTVSVKLAGAIYENSVPLDELEWVASSSEEDEMAKTLSDELAVRNPLDE